VSDPASTSKEHAVPGFVDHHAHCLRHWARIPFHSESVADFHARLASAGRSPMDEPEPSSDVPLKELTKRLAQGLRQARALGIVRLTEMGMGAVWYLDALNQLQELGPLPVGVEIYAASGLAEQLGVKALKGMRSGSGPWVRFAGVKFYADGWLGPRTCAVCDRFADTQTQGILFQDADTLARRISPFAEAGLEVATHAIGDRAVETVLDGYELVFGRAGKSLARAGARIEHGSLLSAELICRIAESGVRICIQPSFAVTDQPQVTAALGQRATLAYPWRSLVQAGASVITGTDHPIEVIEPLVGLTRLVNGHSGRPGFETGTTAPDSSRLELIDALRVTSDASAGVTILNGDPVLLGADQLDRIEVVDTQPKPFSDADGPAPGSSS
jgi:predicted amidohydrolase YtcJ